MVEQYKANEGVDGADLSHGAGLSLSGNLPGGRTTRELRESLSAMMDDEASPFEVRRVLGQVPVSPELADSWRRFHTVRASIKQELHQRPSVNLLPGVHARLLSDNVSTVAAFPQRRFGGRFVQLLAQGAIAASVAGAVLFGYSSWQASGRLEASAVVASAPQAVQVAVPASNEGLPTLSGDYNPDTITRTVSLDQEARNRLERAVRSFSGTAAVINTDTTRIFPNQLEPFRPESADQ